MTYQTKALELAKTLFELEGGSFDNQLASKTKVGFQLEILN